VAQGEIGSVVISCSSHICEKARPAVKSAAVVYDLTPVDPVLHGRNRLRSTIDWAKRLAKLQSEETAIA
jgi:uncharacterized protein YcaQ